MRWDKKWAAVTDPDVDPNMGRPGIGYELLFGFTPTLTKLSVDLGAPQPFSHHLIGRKNIVERIERTLNSDSNVFLIGDPGVGKKTIVLEFARRAAEGLLGRKMAYRRVLEFDHNYLLSESVDVNQKKVKLATALAEAESAGNVILVVRDLHRLTNSSLEGFDFTDVFEEYLEKRKLKVIAITTGAEYEKYLSQNMRLRKYFEIIRAEQPPIEDATEILIEAADIWETRRGIISLTPALRTIIEDSDRYVTDTPFPEKAIELLDAVVFDKEQNSPGTPITADDVNKVLSERTGVPTARITQAEKQKLGKLEDIIHQRLINQDKAINLIGKILRSKSIGVVRNNRPLGSFLFLGPTGVGKTETAKVLAKVYFGSTENILRFDMAEYAGREGLERLIGSATTNLPGSLSTSVQNKPASLLLLDEIEKSPPQILNLFLSLLDEGSFTDAFGKKINGQNLFVIATSNAGASYIRNLVEKNTSKDDMQKQVIDFVINQGIFSPEFINRFDAAVVYEPLGEEHLVQIARVMFGEVAESLKEQGIKLVSDESAWRKLAQDGYDPAFGARPMRRVLELSVGDVIGKGILSGEIAEGDTIQILPGEGKEEYSWKKV
jgi:ATP-dependent Clp protease ATP-binding subunit ClpC